MSHDARPYPNLGYAFLMVLTIVGIQVACSVIATIIATALHLKDAAALTANPITTLIANSAAFGCVFAWGNSANQAPWRTLAPTTPISAASTAATILSTLGLATVLSEAENLFTMVLPIPDALAAIMRGILNNDQHPWLSVFLVVIFAPVTEEILFRGLILRGLLSRMSAPAAIGTSALLFALVHVNPWQFIGPLALGVLFGWWYVRTRSLLPCILGHAVNNGLVLVLMNVPIDIPGFTGHSEQPVHQPWEITLGGALILFTGLWWFHRAARPAPQPASPAANEPPLLA